jgi:hypothetical protein
MAATPTDAVIQAGGVGASRDHPENIFDVSGTSSSPLQDDIERR